MQLVKQTQREFLRDVTGVGWMDGRVDTWEKLLGQTLLSPAYWVEALAQWKFKFPRRFVGLMHVLPRLSFSLPSLLVWRRGRSADRHIYNFSDVACFLGRAERT